MNSYTFIGRSGCGKGTQATYVKEFLEHSKKRNVLYIETGEEFRDFISKDGETNKKSRMTYESDNRQPDFLACYMWTRILINKFNGSDDVIFDGTPRSVLEAEILRTALKFYNFEKNYIIFINVSREWSTARLLERGRSDDATTSKINKRLDWFDKETSPAIDLFKKDSFFEVIEINGERPIDDVKINIISALESK